MQLVAVVFCAASNTYQAGSRGVLFVSAANCQPPLEWRRRVARSKQPLAGKPGRLPTSE